MPQEFQRVYDSGGGSRDVLISGGSSDISIIPFPNFIPSVNATLSSGATATRTSNIVTVTSASHGIPASYVGYRFFYPGSPSLAAGWYDTILSVPGTGSLTFWAPGANFSSESINGGFQYTNTTTIATVTINPNDWKLGSILGVRLLRGGDTSSVSKNLSILLGGSTIALDSVSSSPFKSGLFTICSRFPGIQVGSRAIDGVVESTRAETYLNLASPTTVSIAVGFSSWAAHNVIYAARLEVGNF